MIQVFRRPRPLSPPEDISIAEEPSLPIIDDHSAGHHFFGQTERNIPHVYERRGNLPTNVGHDRGRPSLWPVGLNIGAIPSVAGIMTGPSRTIHPQSHLGPSLGLPAVLTRWNEVLSPQTLAADVINQIRDRLRLLRR